MVLIVVMVRAAKRILVCRKKTEFDKKLAQANKTKAEYAKHFAKGVSLLTKVDTLKEWEKLQGPLFRGPLKAAVDEVSNATSPFAEQFFEFGAGDIKQVYKDEMSKATIELGKIPGALDRHIANLALQNKRLQDHFKVDRDCATPS